MATATLVANTLAPTADQGNAPVADPSAIVSEVLLDAQLEQLERARDWSPRVISKLEAFIRTGDDHALFRVDPLHYAAEKGMSERECIDLFLHASKAGLFDLEWNLLCACCGQVFSSLRSIGKLHTHFVCGICHMVNDVQLDDYILVSFTVASSIRANRFHDPGQLTAEEYVFRYRLGKGIQRGPTCGSNADYFKENTRALTYLDPGASLEVEVETTPGFVHAGDLLQGGSFTLAAARIDGTTPPPVRATFGRPDMDVSGIDTTPTSFTIPTAHGNATFDVPHYAEVPAGRSTWRFENRTDKRACVWVFDAPEDVTSTCIDLKPFLSGKRLITSQTFRELYRSDVIEANEGIGIHDITFLFTDLKGSTALYDQLGDLKAYHLVREHFEVLNAVIRDHSGAIVKTIGDAVMASFSTPLDGLRAALGIQHAIRAFNKGRNEQLVLKLGLHCGHSIAVTLNERIDHFGQTVNIASRVQQLAEANEICISQDVFAHPGASELLASSQVTPLQVNVKGVSEQLQLYKISA